jgi:hypothetical protein
MKVAYFDCSTGISGNMVLGALLDAGLPAKYLLVELKKLKLDNYKIEISKINKGFLSASKIDVKAGTNEKPRTLKEILKIIDSSRLSRSVKMTSKKIFTRLGEAESKIHKSPLSKIHFHELGSTDAIIDVVGASIGMNKLGIKKVFSSALNVGKGRVRTKHGTLNIPAPATAELLKGIPIYTDKLSGELVTPTGAAIITTLCSSFGDMPKIKLNSVGYGAGTYKFDPPNTLKIVIGEADLALEEDTVLQIETNIDNMNPELYDYVIARIMRSGALDAFVTPITMKKKRPAITLSVLSPLHLKDKILSTIFSETTALGVRTYLVKRKKLKRSFVSVKTKYGDISVKVGFLGDKVANVSPEYDEAKKIAKKFNVPIKSVYIEAAKSF